jgi:hypothetical protein
MFKCFRPHLAPEISSFIAMFQLSSSFASITVCYVLLLNLSAPASSSFATAPPSQQFSIYEQLPPGTEIGRVKPRVDATSHDPATTTNLQYSLRSTSGVSPSFVIDQNTGTLSTAGNTIIDREAICRHGSASCRIDLDVVVTGGSSRRYFDVVRVQIEVLDVNDNAPRFPEQSVGVTVTDCDRTNFVRLPPADDPDSPAYSVQNYRIAAIRDDDSTSGRSTLTTRPVFRLSVAELFDGSHDLRLEMERFAVSAWKRRMQRHLSLAVVATDGGSPSMNGTLKVEVTIDCPVEATAAVNVTVDSIGGSRFLGISFGQ